MAAMFHTGPTTRRGVGACHQGPPRLRTLPRGPLNGRPGASPRLHATNPSAEIERDVLDRFWYSRGIVDDSTRDQLVGMSLRGIEDRGEQILAPTADDYVPPGVSSTWDIRRSIECGGMDLPEDVAFASQRIIDLHRFLGSREDIDVVFMVQREPELLRASGQQLTRRILALRIDEAAEGMDVAKLAESQPAL
ncbi:MAG: hypothetical protein ABGY24_17840, partial [bacterium]